MKRSKEDYMKLQLGDVETTALIPLAVKASESKRKKQRITDDKAVEIVDALGINISKYDKFMSHEGVVASILIVLLKFMFVDLV